VIGDNIKFFHHLFIFRDSFSINNNCSIIFDFVNSQCIEICISLCDKRNFECHVTYLLYWTYLCKILAWCAERYPFMEIICLIYHYTEILDVCCKFTFISYLYIRSCNSDSKLGFIIYFIDFPAYFRTPKNLWGSLTFFINLFKMLVNL
jgi:hypothetical protein